MTRRRVGSLLSHRRVASIMDTNTLRRVQRHLLRAFDLDEDGARRATEHLVRRVLDDLGARYARDMGAHIDAIVSLRTRLSDLVDGATRGEHPSENIDTLMTELQQHLDALKPLRQYLEENPPTPEGDTVHSAVRAGSSDAPPPNPRVERLRDRIHEMADGLDADAIESRLEAAERLYAQGRTAEADRIVDEVESGLGIAESAPRRRRDSGEPGDARERVREAPDPDDPVRARERAREDADMDTDRDADEPDLTPRARPPDEPPNVRDRLRAVRERLSGLRDRIASLSPDFARLRDAIDAQLRSIRERLRRGEFVSDTEIEGLESMAQSLRDGVRHVTRRVRLEWLDAMGRRLARQLEKLADTPPSEHRARMEAEIGEIQRALARLRARTDPASPDYDPNYRPGPEYTSLRDRERGLRRSDGDVYLDLTDPAVRARVQAWFVQHAAPLLAAGPIGELLYHRLLDSINNRPDMVLAQSPRSAGERVMQTPELRQEFLDHLTELPADYVAAFRAAAAGTPDGWPVTSAGRAWEVDHVDELWTGGEDAAPNLLALPPGLHRQSGGGLDPSKTGILEDFRREFRDALREADESTDLRESDLPSGED